MFNKWMRKRSKGQSGMVMLMVLVIMVLALFVVVPGLTATSTMLKVNQDLEISTGAYYAAKAGIEDFCWKLSNDRYFTLTAPYTLPDLNGMTVTVSQLSGDVTDPLSPTCVVQSSAKLKGTDEEKAKIFAMLEVSWTWMPGTPGTDPVTGTPGFWTIAIPPTETVYTSVTGYPFKYAIGASDGNITIAPNCKIQYFPKPNPDGTTADLWANGELIVSGTSSNTKIDGMGYYTDGSAPNCDLFTTAPNCSRHSDEDYDFQDLDLPWYWSRATEGGGGIEKVGGSWTNVQGWPNLAMPQSDSTGNTCNTSDEKIKGVLGGPGHISYIKGNLYVDSAVTLKGGISPTDPTYPTVIWVDGYILSDKNNVTIKTDPDYPLAQYYLFAHGIATNAIDIKLATIDANSNLNLMTDKGGILVDKISGPTKTTAPFLGVVYAQEGNVTLSGSETGLRPRVGAIIGKSVLLNSNVDIWYNVALKNNPIGGFGLNVTSSIPGTPGTPSVWKPGTTGTDPVTGTEGFWTPGGIKFKGYSGQ